MPADLPGVFLIVTSLQDQRPRWRYNLQSTECHSSFRNEIIKSVVNVCFIRHEVYLSFHMEFTPDCGL